MCLCERVCVPVCVVVVDNRRSECEEIIFKIMFIPSLAREALKLIFSGGVTAAHTTELLFDEGRLRF